MSTRSWAAGIGLICSLAVSLPAAEPLGQVPSVVTAAVVARRPDAVPVMINGTLRADGTPVEQTYIFWSAAAGQQVWAVPQLAGPPTIAEFPFDSAALTPLPARFVALAEAGVAAKRSGLVKGFESPDNPQQLLSASLTNGSEGCAWRIFGYDAAGAFDTLVVPAGGVAASVAASAAVAAPLPLTQENVARVLRERIGAATDSVQVRVGKMPDGIPTIHLTGRVAHPGVKMQVQRAIQRGIDLPYDAQLNDAGLQAIIQLEALGAAQPGGGEMKLPGRLQFSADGSRLMLFRSGRPEKIEVLDLVANRSAFTHTGRPLRQARGFESLPLQALASDGQSGIAVVQSSAGNALQVFGEQGATWGVPLDPRFVATSLAVAPKSALGVVGGYRPGQGEVLIAAGGRFVALPLKLGVGRCLLQFSPDGLKLAVGETETALVTIWDVATRQELQRVTHDRLALTALDWSADGTQLAAGSLDGDGILIWDLPSGKARECTGLPGKVWSLAFSPDGRRLASSHFNQGVGVWDAVTCELLTGLAEEQSGSDVVAFGQDGSVLYTGIVTASQELRRWDVRTLGAP